MMIRTVLIGAGALVLSVSSANAQGQPQKQVLISKAVLKSMVANKPKSKKALGARIGMVRRAKIAAKGPANAAPTSVQEIRPASSKD